MYSRVERHTVCIGNVAVGEVPVARRWDSMRGLAAHGQTDPKARRTDVGPLSLPDLRSGGIPRTHACLDASLFRVLRVVSWSSSEDMGEDRNGTEPSE
jgi:hypothetical protein